MPDWFQNLGDPLVQKLVLGAGGFVLLVVGASIWQRRRAAVAEARRRAELRRTYGHAQMRQEEVHRQAQHIIATSSTSVIAGFVIVRQIEAVFTDGHRSPADAVEVLKALAVGKGANALVNLVGQRLPSGKCVASGDAVIVRPEEEPPLPAQPPPGPPAQPPPEPPGQETDQGPPE